MRPTPFHSGLEEPRKPAPRTAIGLCVLTIAATATATAAGRPGGAIASAPRPASLLVAESVTIERDDYGVPHISATTTDGAFYGLGWACVQDRFFQMVYLRTAVQGRLAEFLPKPPKKPQGLRKHDVRMRELGFTKLAQRLYDRMDPAQRDSLDAYAQGVNESVAVHIGPGVPSAQATEGIPDELLNLPWDPADPSPWKRWQPWTAQDSIALWIYFGSEFGFETDSGEVERLWAYELYSALPNPPSEAEILNFINPFCDPVFDEAAAAAQKSDIEQQSWVDPMGQTHPHYQEILNYAAQHGLDAPGSNKGYVRSKKMSQAWAVGGDLLEGTFASALFGHPQWLTGAPCDLWEAHMSCADFDVRGAMPPGSPNMIVGSNGYAAWTATALGFDQADVFGLVTQDLDSDGYPDVYEFQPVGGPLELRAIEVDVEEIREWELCDQPVGGPPVACPQPPVVEEVRYMNTFWGPILSNALGADNPTGSCSTFSPPPLSTPYAPLIFDDFAHKHALDDPRTDDPSVDFLRMYESTSAEELRDALVDLSFPSVHAIFADAYGKVGYTPVGSLPLRADSAVMAGLVAQDGRFEANDWKELVPGHLKPWVIAPDDDFVYSANHLIVGEWYPIPLADKGGHTERSRRLRERLEDLSRLSVVTEQDVRKIYKDKVLVEARDITALGEYLDGLSPRDPDYPAGWDGFCPDAQAALVRLSAWAAGSGGKVSLADPAGSTIALSTGSPNFNDSTMTPWISALYGRGTAGALFWLRCRIETLLDGAPCGTNCPDPSECDRPMIVEEAEWIETALCEAWAKTNVKVLKWAIDPANDPLGLCGSTVTTSCTTAELNQKCPYVCENTEALWSCWFTEVHLALSKQWWAQKLHGLPPTVVGQFFEYGTGKATATFTLFSQRNQSYSQFVPLGTDGSGELLKDGAESLLAPGQSERRTLLPGSHFEDQADEWVAGQLKPSPMSCPGPCAVENLTYVPN